MLGIIANEVRKKIQKYIKKKMNPPKVKDLPQAFMEPEGFEDPS